MRKAFLIALSAAVSCLSGYLLSKASVVGKIGISVFYKEYKFLRTWWKTAFGMFMIYCLLVILQEWVQRRVAPSKAKFIYMILVLAGVGGLYFTYSDFRNNPSHRFLGERFHLGGYLFWIGWMLISLYYLVQNRQTIPVQTNSLRDERTGV
jgi:uncharacterized membrane protein YgdD (TMEM256/DUF423 family)